MNIKQFLKNNPAFKFNIIFLSASCFFIWFMIWNSFNYLPFKIIMTILGIGIDIYAQYVLADGNKLKRNRNKRYILNYSIYAVYIIFLAMTSSVGFIVGQTAYNDTKIELNAKIETINDEKHQLINKLLNNVDSYISNETKTGYGQRSKELIITFTNLIGSQDELISNYKILSTNNNTTIENIPQSLHKLTGISVILFKILIYSAMFLMMYSGLIFFPWNLEEKNEVKEKTENEYIRNNRNKVLKYIDAMCEGRSEGVMNSDRFISDYAKFEFNDCIEIRKELRTLRDNGKEIIRTDQGGSKLLISKDRLIEIVRSV